MALVVITGGARSGKSGLAERMVAERGGSVTVVVFGAASDDEMARRIARHRRDRAGEWRVVEAHSESAWLDDVPEDDVLLVDCLGTLLGVLMMEAYEDRDLGPLGSAETLPEWFEDHVEEELADAVNLLAQRAGDTVVVTNEVGEGVVPAYATGRVFRDVLGRANRGLVDLADAAYLVIAGRCVDLKALPRDAAWPEEGQE